MYLLGFPALFADLLARILAVLKTRRFSLWKVVLLVLLTAVLALTLAAGCTMLLI